MLGLLDWRTDLVIKRNYPLGLVILVSKVIYPLILLGMLWFLRYVIIAEMLPDDEKQQVESIGLMSLRGKEQQIQLYSVLI